MFKEGKMKLRFYITYLLAIALLFTTQHVSARYDINSLKVDQVDQNKRVILYTVKTGDTAYSIASKHGVTLKEVYDENPGASNGIKIGQTLRILVKDASTNQNTTINQAPISTSAPVVSSTQSPAPTLSRGNLYEVKDQETLYSIAKKYNCSVDDILAANPGLNPSKLQTGMTIIIPTEKYTSTVVSSNPVIPNNDKTPMAILHQVEAQETLYSISKKYNCSINDIRALNKNIVGTTIQQGDTIYIPYLDSNSTPDYARQTPGKYPTYLKPNDNVIRVAMLLPFQKGSKSMPADKIIEYYEGWLIALRDLKKQGLNAEVYTFDIAGDEDITRLNNILATVELNKVDLIIGGVSDNQIRAISNFTRRAPDVRYIVPFSNKNTGVEVNPNMFQMANSHSNQFDYISKAFAYKYAHTNVVFISEKGGKDDKLSFTDDLQKQLKLSNVSFRIAPTSASITDDLSTVMTKGQQNVVVPTFSSQASLTRLLDAISYLKRKGYDISLFGYPDWQTYTNLESKFYECNTTIYSSFFLLPNNQSNAFAKEFMNWYHKPFINATPKFAYVGYDTGYYFLSAYLKYGPKYPQYIESFKVETLQTAMTFAKVNKDGGYVNVGLYFVTYSPDKKITRVVVR